MSPSAVLTALFIATASAANQPTVIDLTSSDNTTQIAVQICAGLLNRVDTETPNPAAGVYTLMQEPYDSDWLFDLYNIRKPTLTPIHTFLKTCLSSPHIAGYIRYNMTNQLLITPNLITLASQLNAVLLPDNSPYIGSHPLVFDAVTTFASTSHNPLSVSQYMYDRFINQTSTLSFMSPTPLNLSLIDYITQHKLFNFFLENACIRGTQEYVFVERLVSHNPWPKPIPVMGYNTAWNSVFEAETGCDHLHNMGEIATLGFNNLGFMSRTASITKPLKQNNAPNLTYNSSKTYISFTIGDGDNMSYLKTTRRDWLKLRLAYCKEADYAYKGCFPLQWSISPHALEKAPDMLEWYYNASYVTGQDYFVLPPSGHLYAYPSEMDAVVQDNFVAWTENDCRLLGCNTSVAWEFVFTWDNALKTYFPKYAHSDQVLFGFFAVNVPFDAPVEDFWSPLEFFKVLEETVVMFKPAEWRGANHSRCDGGAPLDWEFCLTVAEMSKVVNLYPKGTVTQIYLTSDGGGDLDMFYDLVALLEEHVLVVAPTQLVDLALQADARSEGRDQGVES